MPDLKKKKKGIWIVRIQIACQFHGQLGCWSCLDLTLIRWFPLLLLALICLHGWILHLLVGTIMIFQSNQNITSASWIRAGKVLGPSNQHGWTAEQVSMVLLHVVFRTNLVSHYVQVRLWIFPIFTGKCMLHALWFGSKPTLSFAMIDEESSCQWIYWPTFVN